MRSLPPIILLAALGLSLGGVGCGQNRSTSTGTETAAPQIEVTASVTAGVAPLEVTFGITDLGGPTTSAVWDFGDGSEQVTELNPTHTFMAPGEYSVVVTATGDGGRTTASVTVEVFEEFVLTEVIAAPTAGEAPLPVAFVVTTAGGAAPLSYAWDFGDGESSTDTVPVHTYATAGSFMASVTVTDAKGDTVNGMVVIEVAPAGSTGPGEPPEVTAQASVQSGEPPLEVLFSVTASGGEEPYAYRWDFGDGSDPSMEEAPTHTYTAAGSYAALVTVTGADGAAASASVPIAVAVDEVPSIPVVSVSTSVGEGVEPLEVSFSAMVTGGEAPLAYAWSFGDGSEISTDEAPTHTYTTAGTYAALVTVTGADGGVASASAPIVVEADTTPSLVIDASATSGPPPLEVSFTSTATSGNAPLEVGWDFGDGSAAVTGDTTTHTFSTEGTFTVEATVTDRDGDTNTATVTIEVAEEAMTVLDVLTERGTHTALLSVVSAAGESGTLDGDGPVTLFAPTDAALEALQVSSSELAQRDMAELAGIIQFHILSAESRSFSELTDGLTLTMANGGSLGVQVSDGEGTFVGGATITESDVIASNGLIHVIDAVLNPADEQLCDDFGSFASSYTGMVSCAATRDGVLWDLFDITVAAGDCVHVSLDNDDGSGMGDADLWGAIVQGGEVVYGFSEVFQELDDDGQCTNTAWNGGGCPNASVTAPSAGTLTVAVAQAPGACTDDSPYMIQVAINGVDVSLAAGPTLDNSDLVGP